jgi:signal transduction histidine kinase
VTGYATSPTDMIEHIPDTARAGGALSLLLVGYSGICLCWGAFVPEAAGMLSVVWLGFVEFFMGMAPGFLRFVSLNHWARELADLERSGWTSWIPEVDLWIGAVVLVAAGMLFTFVGVLTVQLSELRFGKA